MVKAEKRLDKKRKATEKMSDDMSVNAMAMQDEAPTCNATEWNRNDWKSVVQARCGTETLCYGMALRSNEKKLEQGKGG